MLADGPRGRRRLAWMSDADRASYEASRGGVREAGRDASIPTTPGRTRTPTGSTGSRSGPGCATPGRRPNAVRARDSAMLALSAESVERTSLLSDLRKEAAAGAHGFYDYAVWECLRSRRARPRWRCGWPPSSGTGSATRRRLPASGSPAAGCSVDTATGERFECDAVVCALPVGPLRRVAIHGVSADRLASLDRQRHALAAKACFAYHSSVLGGAGPQRHDVLRDRHDRRHLAAARGHPLRARPARAPRRIPRRPRRGWWSSSCSPRWSPPIGEGAADPLASSSAAGASTPGPAGTSPAGGPAT